MVVQRLEQVWTTSSRSIMTFNEMGDNRLGREVTLPCCGTTVFGKTSFEIILLTRINCPMAIS